MRVSLPRAPIRFPFVGIKGPREGTGLEKLACPKTKKKSDFPFPFQTRCIENQKEGRA